MPLEFRIELSDLGVIDALRRFPDRVGPAVDRQVGAVALEMSRDMKRTAPKGPTSNLVNSIGVTLEELLSWRVGPSMEYAPFVELGREPGSFPAINPLREWVRRRLGLSGRDLRQATGAIAFSIKRRGIPPKPFVQPVADDPKWPRRLLDAAQTGVQEAFG